MKSNAANILKLWLRHPEKQLTNCPAQSTGQKAKLNLHIL